MKSGPAEYLQIVHINMNVPFNVLNAGVSVYVYVNSQLDLWGVSGTAVSVSVQVI